MPHENTLQTVQINETKKKISKKIQTDSELKADRYTDRETDRWKRQLCCLKCIKTISKTKINSLIYTSYSCFLKFTFYSYLLPKKQTKNNQQNFWLVNNKKKTRKCCLKNLLEFSL